MQLESSGKNIPKFFPAFPEGAIEAIALALDKDIAEIDWHNTDPHDVVMAVMYKKDRANYDWARFEEGRRGVPGVKFPNRYISSSHPEPGPE